MSCRELNEHMMLYLDGLLNPALVRRLEEHAASCTNCHRKLELLQEIPTALRTDQMLAPRPEFTAVVMQQIIVTRHVKSRGEVPFRLEDASQTLQMTSYHSEKTVDSVPQLISLEERRVARRTPKTPAQYMLRFASLAAAVLVVVGVGIYLSGTGSSVDPSSAQASLNSAISSFTTLLVDSFQSPLVLIGGVILAALIIVGTWWYYRRSERS